MKPTQSKQSIAATAATVRKTIRFDPRDSQRNARLERRQTATAKVCDR